MRPPVALTIAGSDSGGGAGLQADLKTFAALGVYGTTAVTAVTAQNTRGVHAVQPVPAAMVVRQVAVVLADLPVAAVKTGMLATAEIVSAVADLAARGRLPHLVVDPVLVATSGDRLLEPAGEQAYRDLLPHAAVLTPNLAEAAALLGHPVVTLAEQWEAARQLGRLGPRLVVVKGGHPVPDAPGEAVDVVWDGRAGEELRRPRVATANTHGTGCTLAAAIAARLAVGDEPLAAVRFAADYVHRALLGAAGWSLGGGAGPLDHFGWGSGSA